MFSENFSFKDFALLAKSGSLKHVVILSGTNIYHPDKTIAPLEDILLLLPNVYNFESFSWAITSSIVTKLFALKRNVKFSILKLRLNSEFIDVQLLDKFLQENFVFRNPPSAEYCNLYLRGEENALRQLFELFKTRREQCFLDGFDDRFWELRVY